MKDAVDNGVQKPNASHPDKEEQEHVGIPVELKICRLRVQDGADQLPFGRAEACSGQQRPSENIEGAAPSLTHTHNSDQKADR